MSSKRWRSVYWVIGVPMVALTSGVLLTPGQTVSADQIAATRAEPQGRRLEGTWRVQITLRNCLNGEALRSPFPAMATFAGGGTVTTADGGLSPSMRGSGHGIWQQTGGHSFAATTEAFLFTPAGSWNGTQRITQSIDIDRGTGGFNARISSEIFDINGTLLATGCATSVGTRLEYAQAPR